MTSYTVTMHNVCDVSIVWFLAFWWLERRAHPVQWPTSVIAMTLMKEMKLFIGTAYIYYTHTCAHTHMCTHTHSVSSNWLLCFNSLTVMKYNLSQKFAERDSANS